MASNYRVRTVFTGAAGSPWLSTMFFDSTGGTALQAATAVRTYWNAMLALIRTGVVAQVQPVVDELDLAGVLIGSTPVAAPAVVSFTNAVEELPPATQGCVKWQTGLIVNGRRLVGKTFVPALTRNAIANDGTMLPATAATIDGANAALVADVNSNFRIWSRSTHTAGSVVSGQTLSRYSVLRSRRD